MLIYWKYVLYFHLKLWNIWVFLNSYSYFSCLIRNKRYLLPKTTNKKTSQKIISIKSIFQSLLHRKLLTHSKITMVGVPKIISPSKNKNSKSSSNKNFNTTHQLSNLSQLLKELGTRNDRPVCQNSYIIWKNCTTGT